MNCRVTCIESELEQLNVRQIAALCLLNEQLANAQRWIRTSAPESYGDPAAARTLLAVRSARVLCLRREPLLDCGDRQRDVVAIIPISDVSDATYAAADVDEVCMSFFSHGVFRDMPVCPLFCELTMRACRGKLADLLAIGSLVIEIDGVQMREMVWTNIVSYIPGRSRG